MCGSAAHFYHTCPQAQPYQEKFTAAARAGGQLIDDQSPQERTPNQLACDMHIRSAGDQKFRRERWNHNGGTGQVRKAEHNRQSEQVHLSHTYYQDADPYTSMLSDDESYYSGSSNGIRTSPQQQGEPGNDLRE